MPYVNIPDSKLHGTIARLVGKMQGKVMSKVLNDSSFMSIYSAYWLQSNKSYKKEDFLKKIDSFSNKIWYKRFVDLL